MLNKDTEILEGLNAIEIIHLNIDWDIIRDYKLMNMKSDINKVGIPDLMILQQVIENKISLFSIDKHFKLMQKHLKFDLITK
ncbi:MAG: hypothetical protein JJU13_01275 [Balneolaceae bacterium]|nr:hypothetical protein [Balneolaceae bacterium]